MASQWHLDRPEAGKVDSLFRGFLLRLKGSARHAEMFLNYAEGRPRHSVELAGPSAGALRFQNMTDEELDQRLRALFRKMRQGDSMILDEGQS
jgi:hypothetical protein